MMLPRKRSRSQTDAGASTSDDPSVAPTQPDLAPQLIHVSLREGDDALKSCFDHVWREVEVPWVRVPFGAPPAVLLTASHGSAEVTWCDAGRPGAHPLRLANDAQLCAAHSVFARLEALFTPSPSIRHPVLGQMPQGFVFTCGDHGLGWYRDRYDERVLKQGLAVPSSDRLPPAEVPVARPLYPEQASCVAWLLARRNEAVFVASAEEVVPLPHPGLGIAVRGYTRVDEGSPALVCHSVGFGKTACALALAAVHLAGQTPTRTLVVCPAHLVHQWESEAAKLLPTRRTARLEPGASSLPAAEVLIATPGGFKQVARRAPSLIGGTPPWLLLLDEAHELASDTTLHEALVALPAAQRVLLTATPPLQDMPALSQLAALAGVAVPARPGELRHFLDACARTSAWTARGIPLEHATVRCRLTRSEQLLYFSERQRVRYEATTTQGAQRLLRACTQFSADAAETLESSVQRELRRRKAELASAEAVLATNGAGQHKLDNAPSGASSTCYTALCTVTRFHPDHNHQRLYDRV